MDETKQETPEQAWISSQHRVESHEDIILRIPRFSTIERFLESGGGEPFDMYNRIMQLAFPKGSKLVVKIINDLRNKASNNLKPTKTINGLNGLFGLHDCIWIKNIKVQVS